MSNPALTPLPTLDPSNLTLESVAAFVRATTPCLNKSTRGAEEYLRDELMISIAKVQAEIDRFQELKARFFPKAPSAEQEPERHKLWYALDSWAGNLGSAIHDATE